MARTLKELRALAEGQGWHVQRTPGGHLHWKPPSGGVVVSPSTPSDYRGILNLRSSLRRAGLALPRKDGRRS